MPAGNPEELENFLFTHEYLFRQQTARFYPLPFALLEQYPDMWDFSLLSRNPNMPWDLQTLGRFGQQIDWQALSANTGMRWTTDVLDHYRDKIHWPELCKNPALPFTDALLERYAHDLNWVYLSTNPAIPLTDVFLEKYQDRIHWQMLKNYNPDLDKVGTPFREKLAALPDTPVRSYILPDHTKRYIRWRIQAESLPEPLRQALESPVSQIPEDFFAQYWDCWDWQNIGLCIHLRWSVSFFERFYQYLDRCVTLNSAFYTQVLEPVLNDSLIEQVCARLNPEHVVQFYYLQDKGDEYGVLPNVRYTLPGNPPYEAYRPVHEQWRAFFSNSDLEATLPEVQYELSWFLRHPIRFADYHEGPFGSQYPAMVVSGKLKEMLEKFELPPHRFYPIDLAIQNDLFGVEVRRYYIFFVPEQEYLYFDFARIKLFEDQDRPQIPDEAPLYHRSYYDSSYFTRQTAQAYAGPVDTPEAFLAARAELSVRAPEKSLRPQEYVWDAAFDLISCGAENPRNRIWVSEDIKKAMEESGATGIRFERVFETRPRMRGLETPEHRLKNAQILESLRGEFQNRAPEPEQITIRNFRAAEAWAEEVRRNKGIVRKLYSDHPATYATDDAFLQKIREKEIQFDVVFPGWFIEILKSGKLPEAFSDFTLMPLEHIYCQQLERDLPLTVKSVVFAEYSSSSLFLALKGDSLYELDDAIWQHEIDQGPPPWVMMRMDKNGNPIKNMGHP